MSANDEIYIRKEMYEWVAYHADVDALAEDPNYQGTEIARADNLESVVEKANQYMEQEEEEGHIVEYGLRIVTN